MIVFRHGHQRRWRRCCAASTIRCRSPSGFCRWGVVRTRAGRFRPTAWSRAWTRSCRGRVRGGLPPAAGGTVVRADAPAGQDPQGKGRCCARHGSSRPVRPSRWLSGLGHETPAAFVLPGGPHQGPVAHARVHPATGLYLSVSEGAAGLLRRVTAACCASNSSPHRGADLHRLRPVRQGCAPTISSRWAATARPVRRSRCSTTSTSISRAGTFCGCAPRCARPSRSRRSIHERGLRAGHLRAQGTDPAYSTRCTTACRFNPTPAKRTAGRARGRSVARLGFHMRTTSRVVALLAGLVAGRVGRHPTHRADRAGRGGRPDSVRPAALRSSALPGFDGGLPPRGSGRGRTPCREGRAGW